MMKCKIKYDVKTSELLQCEHCRHSNHNDDLYYDGFMFCRFGVRCEVGEGCSALTEVDGKHYFLFEEYDGTNCTLNEKDIEFVFPEEK